ncbi:hypothetical protein HELRODRAFT_78435, partial [Helobdella robusta]
LDDLDLKVKEIKKVHAALLSTPHNDQKQRNQLDEHMNNIRLLSKTIRKELKDIESEILLDKANNREKEEKGERADLRIKKLQHSSLMKRFKDSMLEYNDCQLQYREQCKKRIVRTLQIVNKDMTDEEIDKIIESGKSQIFVGEYNEMVQKAKLDLQELDDRQKELDKLEKSIMELRDLFVELAMLVEQQGEMVDNIETVIQQSADYVEKAVKHTEEARKHQIKARKKKMLIVGCVVVALMVIVLIIVLSVVV